jgi:DNA repair protein RecN (Recombination protein N)
MLIGLSIRDFVLIETLDLEPGSGFTSLTGETGAGKSIILDALGAALGGRAERAMVRQGADRASITVSFDVAKDHPARLMLAERGIDAPEDEPITLRRVIAAEGSARAFANDQSTSAALARELGEVLVETHGQHDGQGLLNPAYHRKLMDAYAGAGALLSQTARAWADWRASRDAVTSLIGRLERAGQEREFLEHAVSELNALGPRPGEETELATRRAALQGAERILGALDEANTALSHDVEAKLSTGSRALHRAMTAPGAENLEARFVNAVRAAGEAAERALIELEEANAQLSQARAEADFSPGALDKAEERLFALRAAARKHGVQVDHLADRLVAFRAQLAEIDDSDAALRRAQKAEALARQAYLEAAIALSACRKEAASRLERTVMSELGPLKLEKARFRVGIDPLPEDKFGPAGMDQIAFEVSTNPGAPFGALDKIASGGELARFALALKVALAEVGEAGVLIFDEVDQGVGGAVADAVGARLSDLGRSRQVLAVTHSPQVAARARAHWKIAKAQADDGTARTRVSVLSDSERREELARMLSGAEVTLEARAAADKLIGANP